MCIRDSSGSWDNNLSSGDWFAIENPTTGVISSAENFDGFNILPQFEEITIAPYQDGEPFLGSTVDSYVSEDASDSNNPALTVTLPLIGSKPMIALTNATTARLLFMLCAKKLNASLNNPCSLTMPAIIITNIIILLAIRSPLCISMWGFFFHTLSVW